LRRKGVDCLGKGEIASSCTQEFRKGIPCKCAGEFKERSHDNGAHQEPRPRHGSQRRRHRLKPCYCDCFARPAADSPTAAVLAVLSAESGGATVAVIAGHAEFSAAAARQALLAQEKAGAATRVKGSRPGLPDTWKPAAEPALPAQAPGAGSTPGGQLSQGRPGGHR